MEEIWKSIPGYYGLYEASSLGRIKSFWGKVPIILRQQDNGHGYVFVTLHDGNGNKKQMYVHRIIYVTFEGEISEGYDVDHVNCNRLDNRLSNLKAVTHAENMTLSRENMKKNGKTSTSHPGVIKKKRGYEVDLNIEGIYLYVGHYTDYGKACDAADDALAGILSPAARSRLDKKKNKKLK